MTQTKRIFTLLIAGLVMASLAGCARTSTETRPTKEGDGVAFHGYIASNIPEGELTKRADLVIRGLVLSREVRALRDDPSLPPVVNEDQRRLVEGGHKSVVWKVRVQEWIKGTSPEEVTLVRGISGAGIGIGDTTAPDEELTPEFKSVEAGRMYTFWLTPDDWFKANHWIMSHAVPIP